METLDRNGNERLEQEDNREVLDRARNGDAEAFNQLIALHQDNVRRFVSLRVSNRQDAEDICQEVLMRSCLKLNSFQGRSTLRTWLLSIARRAVSDFYRENRWSRIINQGLPLAADDGTDAAGHCCDFVREICHARQHIEDCLRCVLKTLALEEQLAVLLADVMGCSDKETARILGKNLGALKHLLHRARTLMDLASQGSCAMVRKTGDGSECPACHAPAPPNSTLPVSLGQTRPPNGDQPPANPALLSLRADLLRNIASLIHSDPTPCPLPPLDLKPT